MKTQFNEKVPTNFFTLFKLGFVGLICSEIIFLSIIIAQRIAKFIINNAYNELILNYISSAIVFYFIIILIYLFSRKFTEDIRKILKSKRFDLLIIFLTGFALSTLQSGIGTSFYQKLVSVVTTNQLIIILTLPLIFILAFGVRTIQILLILRRKKNTPFFINDTEILPRKYDLLELSETAQTFAERVLNQNSSDSVVFGIDGPWGVGKTTFVNFCKEYWEEKHKDEVILYVFNPLKYENRENLLEKFIDGLIDSIQKHSFIPEMKPIVSRYARYIKSVKGSLLGFLNFEILGKNESADDAFKDLEVALSSIDKKIIVVIDDLDRLDISAVKDLLFTVKKSFTLPNISYILCYDAENISSLEDKKPDIEKITEFLEKFVNVKISLYLSSDKLDKYISTNLKISLLGNSQADPILVSKAIGGLRNIIKSNDFHHYVSFVGDIRKLKRLINTVLLLDLEKTDFDNSDIDNQDLIHLLLIYINYPNIFRKIYNTETAGKKGFFSLLSEYEDGYPKDKSDSPSFRKGEYKNSYNYTKYLEELSEKQKFLLNKVFNVTRLEAANPNSVSIELRASLACFNGDIWSKGGRNLETYINLITNASKPQVEEQHKFYLNQKNKLLEGESIESILSDDKFSYSKNENNHKQLWKVIVNSAYKFNTQIGTNLINYLLNNIINYPHFSSEDIATGLRHDLILYLVKLIDQAGWVDENGTHDDNYDENLTEIPEWILGEKRHNNNGVIQVLSQEKRGILGFYDLLSFRLFCSADRGEDIFNLSRALAKYDNPNAPTEGSTQVIAIEEMRRISQNIFEVFKKQYINKKINIFDEIDKLNLSDLAGKYQKFIQTQIKSGVIENPKRIIAQKKSQIKMFTIYQLGRSSIEFGVPCGYYDVSGNKDKNGISTEINKYLFQVCFNPGKSKKNINNYEYFLDYLLMNFVSVTGLRKYTYVPTINQFVMVLNKETLREYWIENGPTIKALKFNKKEKKVSTINYIASYKEDLDAVYKVLDELISTTESK